jgi:hypothetical protein
MASVHSQVEISGAGAGAVQDAMFNVALDDYHQADVCPVQITLVHTANPVDICLGALVMGGSDGDMADKWPDQPKPNQLRGKQYDFDQRGSRP